MFLKPSPEHGPHSLDIGIPLYAHTDCPVHVAQIVRRLLEDISTYDGTASHADILQALEIVGEVRLAMSEVGTRTGADFSARVLGIEAGTEALAYAA
jgi:hypothetical protein